MKIYTFGAEDAPVLLLLPGTCCHWKSNFGAVIPLLTDSFRVLCPKFIMATMIFPPRPAGLRVFSKKDITPPSFCFPFIMQCFLLDAPTVPGAVCQLRWL